jgi:hypothetical protein
MYYIKNETKYFKTVCLSGNDKHSSLFPRINPSKNSILLQDIVVTRHCTLQMLFVLLIEENSCFSFWPELIKLIFT